MATVAGVLAPDPPVTLICAHSICVKLATVNGGSGTHVELSTTGRAGAVEGKELAAKEVLARCDAGGDGDLLRSTSGDLQT